MDIPKMLAQLRSERDKIDEAILIMEGLARDSGKRRGRPPKWMSKAKASESATAESEAVGQKEQG